MCLAVPMRIVELRDGNIATVELDGASCRVDVSLIDDPKKGDFVIVHAGFAIERLDTDDADERLELFRRIFVTEATGHDPQKRGVFAVRDQVHFAR